MHTMHDMRFSILTYIMPKTNNKSLQQVTLLPQGVAHSSCTGNDHCIFLQIVFLVVLRYIFHKKEYPNLYAFLGRHDLYYAKIKTINPCNKLLYCFGGSTNVVQNGHCSMSWYQPGMSLLLDFNITLWYIFHKTEYPNFYAFLSRHNLYYTKKITINPWQWSSRMFASSVFGSTTIYIS